MARKVEDLGYSTLFIPDHFTDQWAPLVALTVAAEATTTLRVGTLVIGNDYRHPVVLAKEAATLDLVSEGRLELGIGAGWMTTDYDESGIACDPPAVRVDRLAESIAVLKSLWSNPSTDFTGEHYRVHGAPGYPEPTRRPHPLLMVGGGSRRVLSLAAREADIVGLNPRLTEGFMGPESIASAAPEHYDRRLEWVRAAAGDRFDEIELQCLTFVVRVVDNGRQAIEELAQMVGMSVEDAADTPVGLVGSVAEIVDALVRRRQRWGVGYWVVHENDMEAFAPVVAQLAGT